MKIKHILKASDFSNVIAKGRKISGKTVVAYVTTDNEGDGPSVGIVVSKKVAPRAVQRNYIKRVIYGHFRDSHHGPARNEKIVVRVIKDVKELKRNGIRQAIIQDLENIPGERRR